MGLIKSISGIRGTIGGRSGTGLTPVDVVRYTAAYASWLGKPAGKPLVIGRDSRQSGDLISRLVSGTLCGMGFDVVDIGEVPTPTVALAIKKEKAAGGIVITASHNPYNCNALKLLDNNGECIGAKDGATIVKRAEEDQYSFVPTDQVGDYMPKLDIYLKEHIRMIKAHPLVNPMAIKAARFMIAVDGANSIGGVAIPLLLKRLGVKEIFEINCEPNGEFAHDPEPLPGNLTELSETVVNEYCDIGVAVDPDVDRLALIMEDGTPFGEEYTLVAVADYVLGAKGKGNTVSNLSSTKALREVTLKHGGSYSASAVGEVNVVAKMKRTGAVIGGEGNGGVIVPDFHYGRDALIGLAMFLTHLAKKKMDMTKLKAQYPSYEIYKDKWPLSNGVNVDKVLDRVKTKFKDKKITATDGVKISFGSDGWVHLRESNTEPIIRVYAEAADMDAAKILAQKVMSAAKLG